MINALQPAAGFHAKGIFDKVVDIGTCHLMVEPSNRLRDAVKQWAIDHQESFYDIRLQQGWLRTMQLRICTSGELMVNLVFGFEQEVSRVALMDELLHLFPQITTLLYTINSKGNDSMQDLLPKVYFGKGYVVEKLEDFQFKIGPKSFFQTNTRQAEKLYQLTRSFAELSGSQTVYDLYCGTGSIGIFLSKMAKKVIGVELIEEAVTDARENAALNHIDHAHFFPAM